MNTSIQMCLYVCTHVRESYFFPKGLIVNRRTKYAFMCVCGGGGGEREREREGGREGEREREREGGREGGREREIMR